MKKIVISSTIVGLILITVIWHSIVGSTSGILLPGIFQAKPDIGYVWSNSHTSETRYFWRPISIQWSPGLKHPAHNVIAGYAPNTWFPMLGYELTYPGSLETRWMPGVNYPSVHATTGASPDNWIADPGYTFSKDQSTGNYTTVWTPGIYHPNGKMTAGGTEGEWLPCLGYQWFQKPLAFMGTYELRWVPGLKFNDRHIITSDVENRFVPFPGYQFVDSTRSVEVAWKPGLQHPYYSDLVAGQQPETWVSTSTSETTEADNTPWYQYLGQAYAYGKGGQLVEKIGGEGNKYSNELYKESLVNMIKAGIQIINSIRK